MTVGMLSGLSGRSRIPSSSSKDPLTSNDEKDLFNIANSFGIRHCNDKQKTDYDSALWLSWMFYYYLATVHVLLRKAGINPGC